jgi:hypothetical protein
MSTNFFLEYCFSAGRDFGGSDIDKVTTISAYECQIACQNHADCKFFTYDLSTQNCWLKNAKISDTRYPICISGPSHCYEGKYIS